MSIVSIIAVVVLGFIGLSSGFKSKNKWLMMFSVLPIALGIAQLFLILKIG